MTLDEVCAKIDKYLDKSASHQPILVDAADSPQLSKLLTHYNVGHQMMPASAHAKGDGFPQMDELKNQVQKSEGVTFLTELTTYLKLQGEESLKSQLRSLLDLQLAGKLVIVTYDCQKYLKKFDRRLFDTNRVMLLGSEENEEQPTIYFLSQRIPVNYALIEAPFATSLSKLPPMIERHNTEHIFVTTEITKEEIPNSLLDVRVVSSSYDAVTSFYGELRHLQKAYGTESQWTELLNIMQDEECEWKDMVSGKALVGRTLMKDTAGHTTLEDFKKWIEFLNMKLTGTNGNQYLAKVIAKSNNIDEFEALTYDYLLEFENDDPQFAKLYQERKELLSRKPSDNNALISYCKKVTAREDSALYYLTDNTKIEKETIIKVIATFALNHNRSELESVLCTVYPAISEYLGAYNYGYTFNNYFDLYKYAKVTNYMSMEFKDLAQQEVEERHFLDTPHRAAIVDKVDKTHARLYFIDAMGVEFLAYLQEQCYKRGLDFTAKIAHCNLPSITSQNKEFVADFDHVVNIKALDELKHDGQFDYDYQKVQQPIHIVEELNILDDIIAKVDSALQQGDLEKAVLISDHGASRMAVIAESENQWEMTEKGQHSGRCCPVSDLDETPECATVENDFYCLLNYDRFKGSRKANVEVHGGASLEETLVPVIEITKRNQTIECYVDATSKVVTSSFKKVGKLKVYIGKTFSNVTVLVDGKYYYPATLIPGQQYLYEVEMPDVKKAGIHTFDVHVDESILKKGLEFEMKKEGANERKFF